MYVHTALETYLADLASAQPTPGGGSAAALSGAMASALVCMVARLTLNKAEYAAVHPEIETILQSAEQARERFQQLIQADIDAYGQLSVCFKMPRTSDQERTARTRAIQSALVNAAHVPLEVVELALQVLQYCLRIAEIGNKNVLSDISTAASLAAGSANGAAWMVRVNLHSMKDAQQVEVLDKRLHSALEAIGTLSQQVVKVVEERA